MDSWNFIYLLLIYTSLRNNHCLKFKIPYKGIITFKKYTFSCANERQSVVKCKKYSVLVLHDFYYKRERISLAYR